MAEQALGAVYEQGSAAAPGNLSDEALSAPRGPTRSLRPPGKPDGNERLRPHALTRRGKRIVDELRAGGARRGDASRSRSSSAEKAAAKKRTPSKGSRAPAAARRG